MGRIGNRIHRHRDHRGGALATTVIFLVRVIKEGALENCYRKFRSDFGKAVLLGLEFLIASDIVGTVAIGPTFRDLGILALLVVIRTFLSFSLELEITGRWPWQSGADGQDPASHGFGRP